MKERIDMTELQDQHLDMMIKLAFDMEDAEEVQRILEEPDPALTEDEETFTNAIFVEALNASEQQSKREKRQQYVASIRRVIPRLVEVAACLILVVALATPVALASSVTFRAKVMQLLMELDSEKGEAYFSLTEDESARFLVPEGWKGSFFPSYLPDGYYIYDFDPFFTSILYRNTQDFQFYFDEYDDSTGMTSGIENATVSTVTINGHTGYLIDGTASDGITHAVTIIWQNDKKWFSIAGYGISTNEALMIATSVKEIIP